MVRVDMFDRYEVNEAISILEDDKEDIISKIDYLKSLYFTKKLSEEEWHKLCKTPLRTSNVLSIFVKNIFPEAVDIKVHCNYVYFKLMGYNIQIPTSETKGISVSCVWYQYPYFIPRYDRDMERLEQYFQAVDNRANWKTLASLRCRTHKNTFFLFLWWFGLVKWRKIDRKGIEEKISAYKKLKQEHLECYRNQCITVYEKLKFVKENLLPVLDTFSNKYFRYNNNERYTISELVSNKNLEWLQKEINREE